MIRVRPFLQRRIRFDRNELAGAFGDIGTDLPLLLGMILASGANGATVLIVFGLFQVFSALAYGIPMAVQPLKAVAALVIAQRIAPPVIFGAGLSIGLVMLLLTATGLLGWLAGVIPKAVVRGIQLGLGVKLGLVALREYIPADGAQGLLLAGVCIVIAVALFGNRKCPSALLIMVLGLGYALTLKVSPANLVFDVGFRIPDLRIPSQNDIAAGFLTLALAQIPLSIGNSILATHQIVHDFFPEKRITHRRIGFTYSLMNLVAPFFGGVPVCHGSGGVAGHYAFGARTGGSVLIYGGFFLTLGIIAGGNMDSIVKVFPLPTLGVILLFEGLALGSLMKDLRSVRLDLAVATGVGLVCAFVPCGFLAGMIGGTLVYHAIRMFSVSARVVDSEAQ